jgi:hypothetical protein
MSDYGYRTKDGQVRLVTGDDLVDLQVPTKEQLAAHKAAVQDRTPVLKGYVTKLTPDHVLDRLIRERHVSSWPAA